MRGEPWFFDHEKLFGAVCPDCGGPIYRYCPGCGADMNGKGHAAVKRPSPSMPHPLTVCLDCADAMHAIATRVAALRGELNQPCE